MPRPTAFASKYLSGKPQSTFRSKNETLLEVTYDSSNLKRNTFNFNDGYESKEKEDNYKKKMTNLCH